MKRRKELSVQKTVSPPVDQGGKAAAFQNLLLGLLLVLATVLAYQPAWHAGFIWDDDKYVTNNPLLTAPDGLGRIWFSTDSPSQYFPLTYTVFLIEHAIWGLNPAGYHWVNILLHTINALLVWRLLRCLRIPGAWLAAAIFALHPVQVESVAWITELKSILSLFFSLLTLFCWVEFIEARAKKRWWFYLLALGFYALALFSKTTACTVPAALLLILWLKAMPIHRARLLQIIPFLVLGVGMGLVTMWWERYHQGTGGKLFSIGLPERVLIASHAVWFYAGKLLWPVNLTFSYPRWVIDRADLLAYGWLVAGMGAGVVMFFARRFVGRSVEVAVLFFVAMLSPLLGFIMLYTFRFTFVADHYQYVASIGLIALAAAGITKALEFFHPGNRWLKPLVCGALMLTLGILSWRQCRMYADGETLWRTTIDRNPACWLAHNNLGFALNQSGRPDEAIGHLQQALALNPDYAEAHNNLGQVLAQKGQFDEALRHFERALATEPDFAEAHNNLGIILGKKSQPDAAIEHLQKALAIKPNFAEANYALGNILLQRGSVDEAIRQFEKALVVIPAFSFAHNNLGVALLQKGRRDEASIHFQKALATQPNLVVAQNHLTEIAWQMATATESSLRNGTKAVELAQLADQLSSGRNPAATATLAAAYAETGRYPDAIATAERALKAAASQNNAPLIAALEAQLKSYRVGYPFRDPQNIRTE